MFSHFFLPGCFNKSAWCLRLFSCTEISLFLGVVGCQSWIARIWFIRKYLLANLVSVSCRQWWNWTCNEWIMLMQSNLYWYLQSALHLFFDDQDLLEEIVWSFENISKLTSSHNSIQLSKNHFWTTDMKSSWEGVYAKPLQIAHVASWDWSSAPLLRPLFQGSHHQSKWTIKNLTNDWLEDDVFCLFLDLYNSSSIYFCSFRAFEHPVLFKRMHFAKFSLSPDVPW